MSFANRKCRVCGHKYHACSNCDLHGEEWMWHDCCSATCFVEWATGEMAALRKGLPTKRAFTASRRALTMAEALVRREICHRVWVGPGEKAPSHMETCPKHRTLAAIKAARTSMDNAQGGKR